MSQPQVILILIAGYAAVMTLARLMLGERNKLWKQLQSEAEAARAVEAAKKQQAAAQGKRRRAG